MTTQSPGGSPPLKSIREGGRTEGGASSHVALVDCVSSAAGKKGKKRDQLLGRGIHPKHHDGVGGRDGGSLPQEVAELRTSEASRKKFLWADKRS